MRLIFDHSAKPPTWYIMKLTCDDTHNWAHKHGAIWPGSTLSGHQLTIEVDSNGLYGLTRNGKDVGDNQDCDANELSAIVADHLPENLRHLWPTWEVPGAGKQEITKPQNIITVPEPAPDHNQAAARIAELEAELARILPTFTIADVKMLREIASWIGYKKWVDGLRALVDRIEALQTSGPTVWEAWKAGVEKQDFPAFLATYGQKTSPPAPPQNCNCPRCTYHWPPH